MGILDSNTTELLAIKRAVELITENPILKGRDIAIVSDSKVAVSWVNKGEFGNVNQVKDIYDIREMLKHLKFVKVVFDSRIFNSFADSLAKMGANAMGDFVDWGDG